MEILLNGGKNIKSVNSNLFSKIKLNNKVAPILEYDIHNVLSATEIFNIEREENAIYRIYGKINYLSILNGIKNENLYLEDYFKKNTDNTISTKTLLNSFDFYIVRPHHYEKFANSNTNYIRYFEVIANSSDFDILPAAYSTNIFGEQIYTFNCTKDIDINNYFDSFGFPVTELFLYARYKPNKIKYKSGVNNIVTRDEFLLNTMYYINNGNSYKASLSTPETAATLPIGSIIYGDIIEYEKKEFLIKNLENQKYYIYTPYHINSNYRVSWKYNPLISLRLRYFGNEIYTENINSTIYDVKNTIPNYATSIDNAGNYVWRRILPQGYTDPINEEGVDYPFVNKRRYLFTNIELSISADSTSNAIMSNLKFPNPTPIDSTPLNDLNTFNKPC